MDSITRLYCEMRRQFLELSKTVASDHHKQVSGAYPGRGKTAELVDDCERILDDLAYAATQHATRWGRWPN